MFKRISIFLIVLLTILCFVGSASATDPGLFVKKDAANTYIDYVDADGTSIMKIDDTDGVTVTGGFSASGNFTIAAPVVATNAVYGYITASSAWATSGNLVGLRGKVVISAAGNTGDATGVWAGLSITSASVQRFGLQVGLNVEAHSTTICVPNAVVYIQSLPAGASTDFSDVPYLVFSETRTGTGSNILFEVGHSWAQTIPEIGEDELFYNDTLQIAVNEQAGTRTPFFIPLSTDSGTFTFEYPIIPTYASGSIIDFDTVGTSSSVALHFKDAFVGKVIETGTYASATGAGVTLASTNYRPVSFLFDDGGSELTAQNYRGVLSRIYLSVNTTTMVSIRAMQGHIKLAAGVDLEVEYNYFGAVNGVEGYIETTGTSAMAVGANTRVAAVHGYVELRQATTVASGGILAGVFAELGISSDGSISGESAGVWIDILDSDHGWTNSKWTYGLHIADSAATTGINIADGTTAGIIITGASGYAVDIQTTGQFRMGTGPDTGNVGIPVATSEHAMAVYATAATLHTTATSSFGIRARYCIDFDQTQIVTMEAVDARLRVKQNLADGVHCGIQGTIEASGSPAFAGGLNAAGSFTLDLDTGTTITGSTYMMGVYIDSASKSGVAVNTTTYVALRIAAGDGPPAKLDWEYGIIMDDGDVGVGILIGDCATGIDVGTTTTSAFVSDSTLAAAGRAMHLVVSDTYTGTSGVKGIQVQMTKTSGVTSGAGEFIGIASEIQIKANVSHAYAFQVYTGIATTPTIGDMSAYHAYCDDLGSATVGTYQVADFNIDSTNEATSGNYFIRMYAHGAAPTAAFYFPSSVGIDNLIYFEQSVAPFHSGELHDNQAADIDCDAYITIMMGTTPYYIPLFDTTG